MTKTLRRCCVLAMLASLALSMSCGGGSNSWTFESRPGEYRIELRILTSGCKPDIIRMWDGELEDGGTFCTITVHLETFLDCLDGTWDLKGTHESDWSVVMDDLVNEYVCQFDDRWNLEQFTVTSFRLTYPGDYSSFSASGDFTGHWEDATVCDGTFQLFGIAKD